MTPRPPTPARVAIDEWTARVLRAAYPSQLPVDVLHRAVLMLATADGHLDASGRLTTGRGKGRRP